MKAIYRRELGSYFHSFIGALFISVILFLTGIYFSVYNLFMGYPYIGYALSAVVFLFLISIPVLTMKLLAEERHQKTDQMLLTAPVSVWKIVVGKFLAAVSVFAVPILVISLYPLLLGQFGAVDYGQSYTAILGFFLYGIACISICLFISSLTESQVIAAVLSFGTLFLGYIMSGIANMISAAGNWLTRILSAFDMIGRFDDMLNGSLPLGSVVYYLSVVFLFLMFTVQSIQKRRYQFTRKNLTLSGYSFTVILVSAMIVLVANFFVAELPAQLTVFDVTKERLYSLTEDTKKLLSGLNEDVEIYVLSNEERADSTLDTTLENYEAFSPHIKLSYVDPAVNPKFFTKYTEDGSLSYNSVIVESKKRSKIIDYNDIYESSFDYNSYSSTVTGYDGEGQLTSAIFYVTTENMPKVYMLEGHGELGFEQDYTDALKKANVDYETINLMNYETVPEDASCVIIHGPTEDLSEDDTEKMLSYMEAGGDVLLISAYTEKALPNFNRLLDFYGAQLSGGLLMEADQGSYYQDPFFLLPSVGYDEITDQVAGTGSYVFVPYAQGITLEEREDVTAVSLLTSSDSSYVRKNVEESKSYDKQEGDVNGPFDLGVKCERTVGEETSTGILYSSEYLFTQSADAMVAGTNLRLFNGTLENLVEYTESVSIPVKSYELSYLTVPQSTLVLVSVFAVLVLPGVILITGLVIWLKRRKL